MIKISIIIPVYNSEKFLPVCLDSVINQSLKEIQIIAINDGSKDSSLKILNKYASMDSRIQVIDKKNEGTGMARNVGLEKATGTYVLCVDSDDLINIDTCKIMWDTAEKYGLDFLQIRSLKGFSDINAINVNEKIDLKTDAAIAIMSGKEFSMNKSAASYACGKLWKNSFIKNHSLCFTNNKIGEDVLIAFKSFVYAKKMLVIDASCYYYRKHGESALAGKKNEKFFKDHSEIVKSLIKIIEDENLWDYFGFMRRLFINLYRLNLYTTQKKYLNAEIRKDFSNQIKEIRAKCKTNRSRGVRFSLQVERFYLLPPIFWRFFKM